MKTATITFQAADNYGAFLQAYALQRYLVYYLRVDNVILNYISNRTKIHYKILKWPKSKQDVIRDMVILPFIKKLNNRKKAFQRDREKYLILTKEFDSIEEYNFIIKQYDLCIAGSDQIWNLDSEDFSELYFLPRAKRKISYAASAGNKSPLEWKTVYEKQLISFDKISVRENNAVPYFNSLKLPEIEIEVCIDPTFLLNKSEYIVMAGSKRLINERYIVYYSIKNDDESMKIAEEFGRYCGLPVYAIYSRTSSLKAYKYGMKIYYDAGPVEFLNILNNSEYVLTNSFHGTALSIILQKNFFRLAMVNNGRIVRDDRIDSILETVGLQTMSITKFSSDILNYSIDWMDVSKRLAFEIDHAKKYLKLCVSEEN